MAVAVASSSQSGWNASPPSSVSAPSGVQSGDILIAFIFGKWNSGFHPTATGWTVVAETQSGGDNMAVMKRIATGTDAYSFTNGQTEIQSVIVLRITGGYQDFSVVASNIDKTNGVFDTLDLNQPYANSLVLFGVWNAPYVAGSIGGFAMATSNPSWTNEQAIAGDNGMAVGPCAVASAIRAATGDTGDFSITDLGNDQFAIALIIAPLVSTNPAPSVISGVFSVVAPVISTGAAFTASVMSAVFSMIAPVVTITASKWSNAVKHVSTFLNPDKS